MKQDFQLMQKKTNKGEMSAGRSLFMLCYIAFRKLGQSSEGDDGFKIGVRGNLCDSFVNSINAASTILFTRC